MTQIKKANSPSPLITSRSMGAQQERSTKRDRERNTKRDTDTDIGEWGSIQCIPSQLPFHIIVSPHDHAPIPICDTRTSDFPSCTNWSAASTVEASLLAPPPPTAKFLLTTLEVVGIVFETLGEGPIIMHPTLLNPWSGERHDVCTIAAIIVVRLRALSSLFISLSVCLSLWGSLFVSSLFLSSLSPPAAKSHWRKAANTTIVLEDGMNSSTKSLAALQPKSVSCLFVV